MPITHQAQRINASTASVSHLLAKTCLTWKIWLLQDVVSAFSFGGGGFNLILLNPFSKVGQKSMWLWEVVVRGKEERRHYEQEWVQMHVLVLPLLSRTDMYENATVEKSSQYISARLTSDRRHQGHRNYG